MPAARFPKMDRGLWHWLARALYFRLTPWAVIVDRRLLSPVFPFVLRRCLMPISSCTAMKVN